MLNAIVFESVFIIFWVFHNKKVQTYSDIFKKKVRVWVLVFRILQAFNSLYKYVHKLQVKALNCLLSSLRK